MPEPEIDLDALMAEIRENVGGRRAQADGRRGTTASDFLHVGHLLDQAQRVVNVGTTIPPFSVFGPVRRWLARRLTRVLHYILQVITVDQRVFNNLLLDALRTTTEQLKQTEADLRRTISLLRELGERAAERDATIAHLKVSSSLREHRVPRFLEQAAGTHEPSSGKAALPADEGEHSLDALFVSLEERFRGTHEQVKEGQRVYLPIVREAQGGTTARPILDLGCGRGEWLELLSEEDLCGRGVELNRRLAAQCRERGLDVVDGDALSYLRSLPEQGVGALTAFHLIEHLPYQQLIEVLDETVRVLQPGGVAIFETPNPENVLVSAHNFHLDPTHQRPLPPALAIFLADRRGLCRVTTMPLHPAPESARLRGSEVAERFNQLFCGPQDYALIGWKP